MANQKSNYKVMKTIITFIFITALFFVPETSYTQESRKDLKQYKKENINTDTLKFTVYGMDCPGCEGGLEKQVNKIASVKFSKANWVNQELLIVMKKDSILDQSELERRVKKANFTLNTDAKRK